MLQVLPCCKSFLGLDMAVSVAAGTPCLRRFPVKRAGRVLLYAAEDALHVVRRHLEGICAAAGVALPELDIQVITAPTVRLDSTSRPTARASPRLWRSSSRGCSPSIVRAPAPD